MFNLLEQLQGLEEYINEFINNQLKLDEKTKRQKQTALSYLLEFFQQEGIDFRFDEGQIIKYVAFLESKGYKRFKNRTYKTSTIRLYLAYVKEFIEYMSGKGFNAYYEEKAERRIFKGIKANAKKDIEYLTETEFVKILNYVRSNKPPIYYLLLLVLYYTGLRISEALALMPDDFFAIEEVDEETGEIKQLWYVKVKEAKFGKTREVPLLFIPDRFLKEILAWIKAKKQLSQPVFSYYDDYTRRFVDFSKPHGRQTVDKMLKKIKDELGLEKSLSAHIFRKSYTTRLAEKGVALEDLQRWLGHSDIRTTERVYRAITEKMRRRRDFVYLIGLH